MKVSNLLMSALLVFPGWVSAEMNDDWLGLDEKRYSLHVNYGVDTEDESVLGLGFGMPMPAYSELFVTWSNYDVSNNSLISSPNEENKQQLKDYSFTWSSDPYAPWGVELAHRYRGKSAAVEVTQNQFGLYHTFADWRAGLHYFDGSVTGFRREQIVERFNIADSASVDREGYGLSLNNFGREWRWQLEFQDFDYSRDLSNVLNSRLFLLNFNDAVLSQVLLLTNWNMAFNLEKQFEGFSVNAGVEHYEEVVEKRKDTLFSSGVVYAVNSDVDLGFDYFYFSEDATSFVSLGLVLGW